MQPDSPRLIPSPEPTELQRLRRELKRVEMERDFLKKPPSLPRTARQSLRANRGREAYFPISLMYRVLLAFRSGYYAWKHRQPSPRV